MQFGIFDWVEAWQRAPREVYEHKLALAASAERAGFHGFFIFSFGDIAPQHAMRALELFASEVRPITA